MKHGGQRPGSGAPTKDPSGVQRVKWSGYLHPDTVRDLMTLVALRGSSQGEWVDRAVKGLVTATPGHPECRPA